MFLDRSWPIRGGTADIFFKKNLNASTLDLLSIPQSGGKMSKRLGGIIDHK